MPPDDGDARVGIVHKRAHFEMVRSARAESARCLASARAEVNIDSVDAVESMQVSVHGLPPDSSSPTISATA